MADHPIEPDAESLEARFARHHVLDNEPWNECAICKQDWPCVAVSTVEALRAKLADAEERLREARALNAQLVEALRQIAAREPWCEEHRQFIGQCSIALGTKHTIRLDPEVLSRIASAALAAAKEQAAGKIERGEL